jgi:hypothetical protein
MDPAIRVWENGDRVLSGARNALALARRGDRQAPSDITPEERPGRCYQRHAWHRPNNEPQGVSHERAIAIPRNPHRDLPALALEGLLAGSVWRVRTAIAGRVMVLLAQMFGQFGAWGPLQHGLGKAASANPVRPECLRASYSF